MSIVMPSDANIPYEWQVGNDEDRICMVVPSWSRAVKQSYLVMIDKETRQMTCECPGFQQRGDCHHVRGAKWFCAQPMYRRRGVQRTSVEAYFALTDKQIGDRQRIVLKAITELGPISDKQIAMILGWPINTVTPRRGELVEMGRVTCVGEQVDDKTNRREMIWETVK
jgi:hypothetical protein